MGQSGFETRKKHVREVVGDLQQAQKEGSSVQNRIESAVFDDNGSRKVNLKAMDMLVLSLLSQERINGCQCHPRSHGIIHFGQRRC